MSGQTFLILLACGAFSLAATGLIFACCWTSAQCNRPSRNRRKVRLELGKLLRCSHPEWN
jgi:hypothetical protein